MSIIEKARQLGDAIASSVELEEMRQAENAMMSDPEARQLAQEYNEKQKKYLELRSKGQHLTVEQLQDSEDMGEKIMKNALIFDFFHKQQSFEQILDEVNNIISRALTGEDECSGNCCSPGCGCGD